MIVFSVGMPRSGSGYHFNLINDLLVACGHQDILLLREKNQLHSILNYENCNVGAVALDNSLPLLNLHFEGKSFVVKSHAPPTDVLRFLVSQNIAKATYIYRDPRDVIISALDAGRISREIGEQPFSHLTSVENSLQWILKFLRIWEHWVTQEDVLLVRYERLVTDPVSELNRLVRYFDLDATDVDLGSLVSKYATAVATGNAPERLHFSKGVIGRYREVMSPQELELCNQYLGPYLEKMDRINSGYLVPDKTLESPASIDRQTMLDREPLRVSGQVKVDPVAQPLLSVIIPNFNNEPYLSECLTSVLNQTYPNLEIVVSDDCSTDGSPELIKSYQQKYAGQVKAIFLDKNHGVAFNRNHAARQAKGEYLTTLDSDDYFRNPQKLEREMDLVLRTRRRENKDIIAFSDIVMVEEDGTFRRLVSSKADVKEGNIFEEILTRSCLIPLDFVMLRSAFMASGGYDLKFRTHQTWDLKIRLAADYEFYFTGVPGTAYRRHRTGLSSLPVWERVRNTWAVFNKNIETVNDEEKKQRLIKMFYETINNTQHRLKSDPDSANITNELPENRALLDLDQQRLEQINRLRRVLRKRQQVIKNLDKAAQERLALIHRLEADLQEKRSKAILHNVAALWNSLKTTLPNR